MENRSFDRLVIGAAISRTWTVFGSRLWDSVYLAGSVVVGALLYWRIWGLPRAMSEVLPIIMFSFAPLGLFVFCVFVWNLWLAPAALAYNAISKASENWHASTMPVAEAQPEINWNIWRQMPKWTVREFGAILARWDPAPGSKSSSVDSYVRAILADIMGGTLPYEPIYGVNYEGRRYEYEVGTQTEIKREDALRWAKEKHFACEHVE